MPTKFEYNYSKLIKGSLWKHMVAISFTPKLRREPGSHGGRQPYISLQQEFLTFMAEHYGPLEGQWSVRWSDYGADVRFRSEKDAGSFILFFTENPSTKNDIAGPTVNWWV
jgi:hypothetical protein